MFQEFLQIWSADPLLSAIIWLIAAVMALYLGRKPAHALIASLGRTVRLAARLAARSAQALETRLVRRNKEVVLGLGRDNAERVIEREFQRVSAIVARDLAGYPTLHRQIGEIINRIDDDYRAAIDAPPLPPAWLDAVEAIARIPRNGDAAVNRILENIETTVREAHAQTRKAYDKSTRERHRLLSKMQPMWRRLGETLERVRGTIEGLDERSRTIDEQMSLYQSIRAGDDHAARLLASSSLTQFFIAGMVLCIAVLGGVINFQLIALPMSEMVGGSSQIGPLRTSDVAALVIIMLEIAMGVFLMESLRITHLFPVIGSMHDRMRRRMMWITFAILTILATVEASLAYMRDILALDREALTQSLAGVAVTEAEFRWIPSIGQMVMGFILPFALAFVAIAFESFIHATRTVLGIVAVALVRSIAFTLRLIGGVAQQASKTLIALYDLLILVPLGIEQLIARMLDRDRQQPRAAPPRIAADRAVAEE